MLLLTICAPWRIYSQFSRHKREADLPRMTPEQHVWEYCDEYYHHGFWDFDYMDLLKSCVLRDGTAAVLSLTRVIDEYDPTAIVLSGFRISRSSARVYSCWLFARG